MNERTDYENKLKPWSGICGYLRYKMPEQLLIDEKGTVYYISADGSLQIWCTADRIRQHLHRLYQITNMVEVIKN